LAAVVINANDSGAGSLRDAVLNATDGETITFDPSVASPITLGSPIAITKSIDIVGPGANKLTISGNSAARIFDFSDGADPGNGGRTLGISGLTLANGTAAAPGENGGALLVSGTVGISDVQFTGNHAIDGGGALAIVKALATDAASARVLGSTFAGNVVDGLGAAGGGAILVRGNPALPSAREATLTIVDSTIAGNHADAALGMPGGGIEMMTASVTIISSTVDGNHAGAAGANIHRATLADSTLTIRNSIVADGSVDASAATLDVSIYQPGGAPDPSAGGNVLDAPSTAACHAGDVCGVAAALGPLGDNGGPTQTLLPLMGSPAIDLDPIAGCTDDSAAFLAVDQRGEARGAAANPCDAGAVELQGPNLKVAKTHVGTFPQGASGAVYTIHVTNHGNAAVSGTTTLTDTLPAGLVESSMSGVGWTCADATLTCTRTDTLNAGASYPDITLVVDVDAHALPSVTNVVDVANDGDVDASDNHAEDPTTIAPVADLVITKTHAGNFTQGGSAGSFALTVTNAGAGPSVGTVTVSDTMPAGLGAASIGGSGWDCTLATLTCTRNDSLAAGASWPEIDIGVSVAADAPASVQNAAHVAGGGESDAGNDNATDDVVITPVADLTIALQHVGAFAQGQSGAQYTLTVSNVALGVAAGAVSVGDTLPAGLVATSVAGSGWTCTLVPLGCMRSDTLASGASYPVITLTVDVAVDAPASVTNTAVVSGGGELVTGNDSATDVAPVTQFADLVITKTHAGGFTQSQVGATYSLSVRNAGAAATTAAVSVSDTLPVGLAATAIAGTGWTCSLSPLGCTRSDALGAGASYPPIVVSVDVAADAPASLTNVAAVSGGGEANAGNDSASDVTAVSAVPDLVVVKAHADPLKQGQVGAVYTLTVSNSGGAATSGTVTLADALPAGFTATAVAGSGWTCTLATLTCTRGDALAAGASYPVVQVTVDVAANALASVVNHATVSGGGEVATANDGADDPTTITALPVLAIAKRHDGTLAAGASGVVYTIVVSNIGGAATAAEVDVADVLPHVLTATALGGSGWTCTLATLACTRSDALAPGASYPPITLTVNVAIDAPATIVNIATAHGGGEDASQPSAQAQDAAVVGAAPPPPRIPALSRVALALLALLVAASAAVHARRRGHRSRRR
jgi:uncharacterized repeat protein (TIGR01451 family)